MSRRLLALAAVLTMTLASALILQSLVVLGVWLPRTLLCTAVAALVTTLLRTRSSSAGLPSLGGLVAGLVSISAVYFPGEALLRVIPTPATFTAAAELISTALTQMRDSYPPLTFGEGVSFLITTGVLIAFVLAEMLAVGAWAPAWSGLPMLTLWSVPILLGASVSVPLLVVAAAAYVLLIAVQARDDARYRRRPSGSAARMSAAIIGSVLVVAFILAPSLLRIPAPIRVHPFYELVGSSTTRLDLGLGLRDDLLRDADADLIVYSGAAPEEVGPLHSYTLVEFTGSDWVRSNQEKGVVAADQMLWPSSLDGVPLGPQVTLDVMVESLGQDRLLLPGEPRTLRLPAEVEYLPGADEAVAHIGGEVSYDVTFLPRELDAQALEPAGDVDPALLQVPETGYQSDIADLTREVVSEAGAGSAYEQLVAIQNYLRDPARFVYSTSIAAPRTPDAVWDFLNDKHGYCVQFATAMIVMARTLGIPARLAVGFLPGEASSDGTVRITAHDAHAWPQILFEDVGWVRFEPTPGVQAGMPPEYAPETSTTTPEESSSSAAPTRRPTADSTQGPTPTSSGATSGAADDPDAQQRGPWPVVLIVLIALAAVASAMARRHAARQHTDLRERWEHVLRYLGQLGVDVDPSRTPRAVLDDAVDVLPAEAAAALTQLADAVEVTAYRPAGTPRPSDGDINEWVDTVVDGVRLTLRERSREPAGV